MTYYCMRYDIPQMVQQGGGAIRDMASILGAVGFATACAYVAAKHGVVGLTKVAALGYASLGMGVLPRGRRVYCAVTPRRVAVSRGGGSMRHAALVLVLCGSIAIAAPHASAQGRPDTAAKMAAQRDAMAVLAFMDGVWRGPAWTITPTGEKHSMTQTERVGAFLDGAVKVIEGRGYGPDGKVSFNALGIVSFDPDRKAYSMRSYAMGHAGDFALTAAADGFTWEIPAGPATMRYTAKVSNGTWHEVGDRIVPGQEPVRFFEMTLTRVGDTGWPAADPVSPE